MSNSTENSDMTRVNPPANEVNGALVNLARPVATQSDRRVPAVLATAPNLAGLVKALRRRWLLAGILGILAALAAAAAVWTMWPPGKFTAYAKLYMPATPKGVLFGHPEAGTDFATFQKTQVALLKSRSVLKVALRNPKVVELYPNVVTDSNPLIERLEKQVKVEFPDGPEIPRLVLSGDDAARIAALLEAIVGAYFDQVVNKQTVYRQEHLDQLKAIAAGFKKRLQKIQDERNDLAKAIGASDNAVILLRQELVHKELALTQAEAIKGDADLRKKELEVETLQARAQRVIEVPENVLEASIDKELAKDLAVVERLHKDLAELRELVHENNPRIRLILEDLKSNEKAIADKRTKLRPVQAKTLAAKAKQELLGRLALLNDEIQFTKQFQMVLRSELDRLEKKSQTLNTRSLDIDAQRLELQQAESGVIRVMAEIDKVTVELPSPPRVSLLEGVVVHAPEEATRKVAMAAMSGAGAFAAILLFIALLEFRSRRIDSVGQVVDDLGLQIIGTFPTVPRKTRQTLLPRSDSGTTRWDALLAESVDSMRTLLVAAATAKPPWAVMVTSAVSGEGKTFLATRLAASFAHAGFKTLLVDGDLRRQGAGVLLKLPQSAGFSELLRGQTDPAVAIQPSPLPNLSLLPAGNADSAAIQLLARDAVPCLLDRLKREFEIIVIDSSPVLPVADALQIARHVDGVLISLFHKVSRLPNVFQAYHKLNVLNVRVFGSVITGTDEDTRGYSQYYAIHEH